jgi:hypothetical protein
MAVSKKRQSKSVSPASSKCEFCKKTGSYYTVAYHRDQVPPVELKKFKVLYDEGFRFSIIRCPKCRTVYMRHRYVDNEPGNESDEDVYTEISEEKLNEQLPFFMNKQKEFKSRFNQRLKVKMSSLSKDERAALNIFIKYQKHFLQLDEFEAKAAKPLQKVLLQVLAGLAEKGVLKAFGSCPNIQYSVPDWD